jgi:hypothetical protein
VNSVGPGGQTAEDWFREVLPQASRLDIAVAYARASGIDLLRGIGLPGRVRIVAGTGFGHTDPAALERLHRDGVDVWVHVGGDIAPEAFHPKLYLVERGRQLHVASGSGNLTQGGLRGNFEQFEFLRFRVGTPEAREQRDRFEVFAAAAVQFGSVAGSLFWEAYRQLAKSSTRFESTQTTQAARHAPLIEPIFSTRHGQPGLITTTDPAWWRAVVGGRGIRNPVLARGPQGRPNLRYGGRIFHLIRRTDAGVRIASAEQYVAGFSTYLGESALLTSAGAWARYRRRLGYASLSALTSSNVSERADRDARSELRFIELTEPTTFIHPIRSARLTKLGIILSPQTPSLGLDEAQTTALVKAGTARPRR